MSNIGRPISFIKDQTSFSGTIVRETTKKGKARFIVDCGDIEFNISTQFVRFLDLKAPTDAECGLGYAAPATARELRELNRAGGDATILRR